MRISPTLPPAHFGQALVGCLSLGLFTKSAQAQYDIGPTKGQAVGILVAIAAIGAGIGVGIYFLARRPASVTGCAASGPSGLTPEGENDHQTLTLTGDTSDLKSGDRLRVIGKRKKKDAAGNRSFVVSKLKRDFGYCKIQSQPSTP